MSAHRIRKCRCGALAEPGEHRCRKCLRRAWWKRRKSPRRTVRYVDHVPAPVNDSWER